MTNLLRCVKYWVLAGLCVLPLALASASSGPTVNVNTATAEEIATLDNIGQVKAEAIVEYREANGPFASVQALTDVTGIGDHTVERNLDRITLE